MTAPPRAAAAISSSGASASGGGGLRQLGPQPQAKRRRVVLVASIRRCEACGCAVAEGYNWVSALQAAGGQGVALAEGKGLPPMHARAPRPARRAAPARDPGATRHLTAAPSAHRSTASAAPATRRRLWRWMARNAASASRCVAGTTDLACRGCAAQWQCHWPPLASPPLANAMPPPATCP